MGGPYTAYFVAAAFASSGFLDSHPVLSLAAIFAVSMAVSHADRRPPGAGGLPPLRNAPRLVPLITAIGASFLSPVYFPGPVWIGLSGLSGRENSGGPVAPGRLPDPEIPGRGDCRPRRLLMAALYLFVQRTRVGKAIRGGLRGPARPRRWMGIGIDRMIGDNLCHRGDVRGRGRGSLCPDV